MWFRFFRIVQYPLGQLRPTWKSLRTETDYEDQEGEAIRIHRWNLIVVVGGRRTNPSSSNHVIGNCEESPSFTSCYSARLTVQWGCLTVPPFVVGQSQHALVLPCVTRIRKHMSRRKGIWKKSFFLELTVQISDPFGLGNPPRFSHDLLFCATTAAGHLGSIDRKHGLEGSGEKSRCVSGSNHLSQQALNEYLWLDTSFRSQHIKMKGKKNKKTKNLFLGLPKIYDLRVASSSYTTGRIFVFSILYKPWKSTIN